MILKITEKVLYFDITLLIFVNDSVMEYLFFSLLVLFGCTTALKYETLKFRIAQSAVDYINQEIREVIPTIEAELQDFRIPDLSDRDYRLYNLKLKSSKIGTSTINFQDNGLRLKLANNYFVFGGSFWIKKIIGIEGNVKVTASNLGADVTLNFNYNKMESVSLESCRVYIGKLDINLYQPLLNFILGILKGAITGQARSIICNQIRDTIIPSVNRALANLPDEYKIGEVANLRFSPGSVSVNSEHLTSAYFGSVAPLSGEVDWNFREVSLPSSGYTGQCCLWVSEHLLNTAAATLMAPGKLETSFNAAESAGLPDALRVDISNSAAPVLTLYPHKVYLTTSVNTSLYGEDSDGCSLNLGHYSTVLYLNSDTDITYQQFREMVKEKTHFELPIFKRDCVDNHENCGYWANRGECEANPGYMLNWCKRSCKVCSDSNTESCIDHHNNCAYWARKGECQANPEYMLQWCKKSCNACDDGDDGDVETDQTPIEYLLNEVLPTSDYIQFYDAKSDMLDGSSRTCGKFRPTPKTRDMIHGAIRSFLRSQRS